MPVPSFLHLRLPSLLKKSTRALWTFMGWPTLLCLKVQSGKIIDTYISRPTFNEFHGYDFIPLTTQIH